MSLSAPKITFADKNNNLKQIFEPVSLNKLHLKNRLIRSATWEAIAERDGALSQNAYDIYEELAKGGIGAIITSYTSVSFDDVVLDKAFRLSDDKLIPDYKKLAKLIQKYDCKAIVQLALGAYYLKNGEKKDLNDLTQAELKSVVTMFKEAARRAKEAGFDGIQIHAAHGFFLSQFMNKEFNHRKDNYGGSTENRARLLTEVISAVKEAAPDLHITIKINSAEEPHKNEALAICKIAASAGLDSMEISGNNTARAGVKIPDGEGYFADFAAELAKEVKTPIYVVGGMRSKAKIKEVLANENIEMVSLSRPLLREPDLPNLFKTGASEASKCISCNACFNTPEHRCIFRK